MYYTQLLSRTLRLFKAKHEENWFMNISLISLIYFHLKSKSGNVSYMAILSPYNTGA